MKFHDELNPKLWDKIDENNYDLKPDVKDKLQEIADAFIEYLEIPTDSILDIVITGSSASYNYNKYSDLDLHIIVDYEKVHEDCPLVNGYLNSLKKQFNDAHDIFIHDIPVELYAEQKDVGTVHNGLYSLNTGWIDIPKKIPPTDNDAAVEAKFNEIKDMVEKCDDSEEAVSLLEKIYTMRKAGLATAGEFCTENLVFKKLRNDGCITKLKQLKKEEIDKQLSLESFSTLNKRLNKLLIENKENITNKIEKLIDNVNKTALDAVKNKKEAQLYTLKQETNQNGQKVLKLYRGDRLFMSSKLAGDTLLGDDILGHLSAFKSSKYESLNEGMWESPFTMANAKKVTDLLSKPITFLEIVSDEKKKELWDVIGDDTFWDEMEDLAHEFPDNDAREVICNFLTKWIKNKKDFNSDAYDEKAENIVKQAITKFYNKISLNVDEDLATLEKKLDTANKNVQDIISNIEGSSSCTKNENTEDDKKFTYFLYLGDKAIKENYYMGGVSLQYAEKLAKEAIKELGFSEISIFKAENNDKPKYEEDLEFVKTIKRDTTNESLIQKLNSVIDEALSEKED